jgi:hypothetical protein
MEQNKKDEKLTQGGNNPEPQDSIKNINVNLGNFASTDQQPEPVVEEIKDEEKQHKINFEKFSNLKHKHSTGSFGIKMDM